MFKIKKMGLTFKTFIDHEVRKAAGLSINEYCLCDAVFQLQRGKKASVQGWCNATNEALAKAFGLSESTVRRLFKSLEKRTFIEKRDRGLLVKTTSKYFNLVVRPLNQKKVKSLLKGGKSAVKMDGGGGQNDRRSAVKMDGGGGQNDRRSAVKMDGALESIIENLKKESKNKNNKGNFVDVDDFKNSILKDFYFVDWAQQNFSLKNGTLENFVTQFINEKKAEGTLTHRDYAAFKRHVMNWIRKRITSQNQNQLEYAGSSNHTKPNANGKIDKIEEWRTEGLYDDEDGESWV